MTNPNKFSQQPSFIHPLHQTTTISTFAPTPHPHKMPAAQQWSKNSSNSCLTNKRCARVSIVFCTLGCLVVLLPFLLSCYISPTLQPHEAHFGPLNHPKESGILVDGFSSHSTSSVESCSPFKTSPDIGNQPYMANFTQVSPEEVQKTLPYVLHGGHYQPRHCKPLSNVAVIVPFRERDDHLGVFLNNIHFLLIKQNVQYRIFLIHQKDENELFNHGVLNNVGFLEAQKIESFDCLVFHDVDTIPVSGKNLYHCPFYPFHLSVVVEKQGKRKPVESLFGGVVAVHRDLFVSANGYSNGYWGWGGEDDDLYFRLLTLGLGVLKNQKEIGVFKMQRHLQQQKNPQRIGLLKAWKERMTIDGLKSTSYTVIQKREHRLYTEIEVQIPHPSD